MTGDSPKVSGLAVASLVLAVLWLWWVGTVLAAVFALITLRDMRRSRPARRGRGLAVAALVFVSLTAVVTLTDGVDVAFPAARYLNWAVPALLCLVALVAAQVIHRPITIEQSTDVAAPPADIYGALSDPRRWSSWAASRWTVVGEPEAVGPGRFRARMTGRAYGAHISCTVETTQAEPHRVLVPTVRDVTRDVTGRIIGLRMCDECACTISAAAGGGSHLSGRNTWRHAPVSLWGAMPLASRRLRRSLRGLGRAAAADRTDTAKRPTNHEKSDR